MRYWPILALLLLPRASFGQSVSDTGYYVIDQISIRGNKKTKGSIILREATFAVGDTLRLADIDKNLARTQNNIFNTTLFNKVTVKENYLDSNRLKIDIEVDERWYIWPYPILENADRNFSNWWKTKDFNRLSYGINLNWYNFRGRGETLQILGKLGFEQEIAVGYDFLNINKAKTLGLYIAGGYANNKEVNYGSVNNKRLFYKDEGRSGRQVYFGKVALTYRKGLYFRQTFTLGFQDVGINKAITGLSSDYLKNNKTKSQFFSASYDVRFDTRDYIEYPLTGIKLELLVTEHGFGVLNNENLFLLTARAGINLHKHLGGRWYIANTWVAKLSFLDDPPYYLQQGLGYKDFVRGYEFYVVDAQNYGLMKFIVKFALVKKKEFYLKKIPFERFNKPYFSVYLNAFTDAGYGSDKLYGEVNSFANRWVLGYGLGLDISAFYDFVMRIEYSFNVENESGFFLHFKKAI